MSRKDQLFQGLNSIQNHVYDYIDNHPNLPNQPSSSSSSRPQRTNTGSGSGSGSAAAAPPPLYGGHSGEAVPPEILYAPPGQAQRIADQLPASRMARGDARDARRAAAALRNEQSKNGQLKKRHTFASSNGRIILDIQTSPQRILTYVGGGSVDGGRGAMKGKVIVHAQEGDRISAIRLKIKAVVRVMLPKSGTPQTPLSLDTSDPLREPTSEKEVLLLQLESKLYSVPTSAMPAGSTSHDPTLLNAGTYEYPFHMEIPSQTSKGQQLPPSFVLSPNNLQARGNAPSSSKGSMFKLPLPLLSSDWATVKWYAKLTVERPGIFRANDRIFAPFVYLPPPPRLNGIDGQLEKRARLAVEVDNALRKFSASNYMGSINLESFVEPVSSWDEITIKHGLGAVKGKKPAPPLANEKSNEEGPGFLSRLLFGGQVDGPAAPTKEVWTFAIPKKPHVFPLRSGIPFLLTRTVEWRGSIPVNEDALSKVPHVVLLQRTNVFGRTKGPVAGTAVRMITDSRQTPATRPASTAIYQPKGQGKNQVNRRGDSWLGIIDLPPACTPCFDTPVLTLDYYLSVRVGAGQSIEYLHSQPIVICCPPSRPTPVVAAAAPRVSALPRSHSNTTSSATHQSATKAAKKTSLEKAKSSIMPQLDETAGRNSSSSSTNQIMASNSNAGASSSSSSSSRARPAAQVAVSPIIDEKKALHQQYHRQQQNSQAQISAPPSRSQSPSLPISRIPPVPPTRPVPSTVSSRAPSEAGTNEDEEEDSNQWLFHEDELTDLPPSYFEATAADQDD